MEARLEKYRRNAESAGHLSYYLLFILFINAQDQLIQRNREAGQEGRNVVEAAVAHLVHAPGVGGRSLQIDAIGDRVMSQSGRVVARRREEDVIPQVQQPARVPAAVSPGVVVSNIARNQPAQEDPFLRALLALNYQNTANAQASHPRVGLDRVVCDPKNLNEARSVEVQTLIRQFEFAKGCIFPDEATKKQVLGGLQEQILGSSETLCAICQQTMIGLVYVPTSFFPPEFFCNILCMYNVARMPCCGGSLHVNCLIRLPYGAKCPFCRADNLRRP